MSDINPLPTPISSSPALEDYHQAAVKRVRERKDDILHALRRAGVARIEARYDGCGDSGQIEEVTLLDHRDREIAVCAIADPARTLEDFLYDLLETRHDGWETDDGADGEFAWDILQDRLLHTHRAHFTDTLTTEHEGV